MKLSKLQSTLFWSVTALLFFGTPIFLWLVPPPLFSSATVNIYRGLSISDAAEVLTDAGVIYTPELVVIPFLASGNHLVAGTYKFDKPINASTVVNRLAEGDFQAPQGEILIPEGFTNEQIADRLTKILDPETFSRDEFIDIAYSQQGYLYPDTYNFHANATSNEIISVMRSNFEDKVEPLADEIKSFQFSWSDVLRMATLVELEAADYEIRRKIAGVLWNRIENGMPLQVDAAFMPLIGKNTYELTISDLQLDSPYNLYTNTGLPPRPIANPSIESIRATIDPVITDDIYYLSYRDGNFYFAETLIGHAENRRNYMGTEYN
jgi:UPF0755 protein